MRTSADKDGDDYIINGSKIFITNGQQADIVIVVAKTDKDAPAPIITSQDSPPPVNPDLHIGSLDEDGGDGTLAP